MSKIFISQYRSNSFFSGRFAFRGMQDVGGGRDLDELLRLLFRVHETRNDGSRERDETKNKVSRY